jgi:hypothetical protein
MQMNFHNDVKKKKVNDHSWLTIFNKKALNDIIEPTKNVYQ